MNPLVRLGWRDLTRNRRFSLLFIVNLALGLTGLLLTGSFSASLDRHLATHLKEIVTGDLILQATRPLTERELDISRTVAGPGSRFSRQVSFYTMVRAGGVSKLAQIVAIDDAYPLYGGFRSAGHPLDQAAAELQLEPRVLMSRETARSFGLAPGDTLAIGEARFAVAPLFDHEPGGDFTSLTLAPKIYLGLPHLDRSGLIRFGSRVNYKHFIRLPDAVDGAAVAARLAAGLEPLAKTPEIRMSTPVDVNRRMGRVIGYFNSFLSLTAMVSLALAGLAAAYLFREHLLTKMHEIAVLLSLGASRRQCLLLAMAQSALLGLIAASAALVLAWLLLPLFAGLFSGLVPAGLDVPLDQSTVALALLVGALGSPLFCLPGVLRILTVRPLLLLQEQAAALPEPHQGRGRTVAALAPALILLLLLTLGLSQSPLQGFVFTAGLAGLIALFSLAATLLFLGCRRWSAATAHLTRRLVWRNLYRNRRAGTAVFVALATALLLVNLIPQIEKGLTAEIGQPEGMELPDLFLIDIQEEQGQPLLRFFQEEDALLSTLSPMVQGRIVSINGQPFARWRQQHPTGDDRGLRRTEFNFSSRVRLDASETVIAGPELPTVPWQAEANQPFALSLEQEFSKRLQVGIGDRMVVDIQGIEMEGRIVNLRQVRWNSFQPNFFMLVQPGVLDDAPKTYLASVSRVEKTRKDALVNRLTAAFPNISVLDVTGTVGQMVQLAGRLTLSLRFLAGLAMATGLVTVVAIARQEALRREQEINLLRVLGAGRNTIRTLLILEFAFLAAAAALAALFLSTLCSFGISWLLFDRLWQFQWQSGVVLLLAATLACSLTALAAAEAVIRRTPVTLLH